MNPAVNRHFREFTALLACAVFLVYSWTTYVFLWQLRSHLMRLSLAEIASFLSYQYAYSLIESVLVALFAWGLVLITPVKQIRAQFAAAGSMYLCSLALSLIFFMKFLNVVAWTARTFALGSAKALSFTATAWVLVTFGLLWLSAYLAGKTRIRGAVRNFLENLYVLSGLYVGLGLLGVSVAIYRNLP